ncbi:MAG: outer membrane lipoprotein-sorting protein [Candidatus Atribacteria bacterium]|nr:outer membrane lipoprotein-sorting protein [Candidatus Atribacteria bacterium]
MKKKYNYVVIILMLFMSFCVVNQGIAQELTGKEIIEHTESIETLKDLRGSMEMQIINKSGKARVRELTIIGLENEEGIEKSLIRFLKPSKVKGTGFLTISNPDGPDESYLYLPALGKPRRLSSEERGGNFMGSDFTNEDMSSCHEDYEHNLLNIEEIDDVAYYVVESVPKTEKMQQDVGFARKLTWISHDKFQVLKMEVLDINGKIIRILNYDEYQEIEKDAWIPTRLEMATIESGSRTILEYKNIEVNTGLTDDDFSIRQLTRPL